MPTVVDWGSPADKTAIPLVTRTRRWIRNSQELPRAPLAMRAAAAMIKTAIPSSIFRSASSTYNCMGLVFASRRTAIDPESFGMLVQDDGYLEIPIRDVMKGDVVSYAGEKDGQVFHVAVVQDCDKDIRAAAFKIEVLSQFGRDGEYLHLFEDLPVYLTSIHGTPLIRFWSERLPI